MVKRARGVALRDGQERRVEATSLLLMLAVAALYARVLKGSAQQTQQDGLACCLCVRTPVGLRCVHQP